MAYDAQIGSLSSSIADQEITKPEWSLLSERVRVKGFGEMAHD